MTVAPANPEDRELRRRSPCPRLMPTVRDCPVCGVNGKMPLGRERCGVCEADILGGRLKLADRAAELRLKARQQKPAPQDYARLRCGGSGRYA